MTVRLDAHHHVWDRPQPWTADLPVLQRAFDLAELEPQLGEHDVAGSIVVQTVASADETRDLLALAAAEPLVVGVVGWFDLEDPALADVLAATREDDGGAHLVGARHQLQVEPDPHWIARPSVGRGLAELGRQGLVYDVVVSPDRLGDVAAVVAAHPGVSFVLDHAGKPPIASGDLAAWADDVRSIAAHDHVSVKLSGLVTEASWTGWTTADLQPAADVVLQAFGPDRVMFASDWPVCLLADASYARVVESVEAMLAGLSPAEADAVWGGTAQRVYGVTVR